jgi:glycosyltransferase involved in cell wall biosynthesis
MFTEGMTSEDKRILFVVDGSFFPIRDGSSQRYYVWLQYLNKFGYEVYFLSFNSQRGRWDSESLQLIKKYVRDYLIIDTYSSPIKHFVKRAFMRLANILMGRNRLYSMIERFFYKKQFGQIQSYITNNSVSDFAIIVNKPWTANSMGLENLKNFRGLKIIDIHDIHASHFHIAKKILMRKPIKEFIGGIYANFLLEKFWTLTFNYKKAYEEEINILSVFDKVLVTSVSEVEELRNIQALSKKVRYLPLLVIPKKEGVSYQNTNKQYDFGFIGSSGLFNVEAIEFFGNSIIPHIRERRQDFRCLIAGPISNVARGILASERGIEFLDSINDLNDFYGRVKIVIVPLLSGTGVSVKTLEAMNYGCPVLSTTVGVRGLEVKDRFDIWIEDDPKQFAESLVKMLDNDALQSQLMLNALTTISGKYSLAWHYEVLNSVLNMNPASKTKESGNGGPYSRNFVQKI